MKSTRTIITITEEEKRWLAAYRGLHGVSLAAAVRRAIACLKAAAGHAVYRKRVRDTGGIWDRGDALRYQEDIRSEWGKLSCSAGWYSVILLSAETSLHRNPLSFKMRMRGPKDRGIKDFRQPTAVTIKNLSVVGALR